MQKMVIFWTPDRTSKTLKNVKKTRFFKDVLWKMRAPASFQKRTKNVFSTIWFICGFFEKTIKNMKKQCFCPICEGYLKIMITRNVLSLSTNSGGDSVFCDSVFVFIWKRHFTSLSGIYLNDLCKLVLRLSLWQILVY